MRTATVSNLKTIDWNGFGKSLLVAGYNAYFVNSLFEYLNGDKSAILFRKRLTGYGYKLSLADAIINYVQTKNTVALRKYLLATLQPTTLIDIFQRYLG